jgi:tetratricopeptide (TPR) repeat protein
MGDMGTRDIQLIQQVQSLLQRGMLGAASEICLDLLDRCKEEVAASQLLAQICRIRGEYADAVELLDFCVQSGRQRGKFLAERGHTHLMAGRGERAIKDLEEAATLLPHDARRVLFHAHAMLHSGRHDEGLVMLDDAHEIPEAIRGDLELLRADLEIGTGEIEQGRARSLAIGDDETVKSEVRALAIRQAARSLEKEKRYDEAMAMATRSHEIHDPGFNPKAYLDQADAIIDYFSRERLRSLPRSQEMDPRPVFIVGLPRSGTSLTETILDRHPQVQGLGELGHIEILSRDLPWRLQSHQSYPHCLDQMTDDAVTQVGTELLETLSVWGGSEAARLTDKALEMERFLGLISLVLPGARIIHCRRNVRDICVSCYMQDLNAWRLPWITSTEGLVARCESHHRLMRHWKNVLDLKILTIDYESLVDDQERWTREMIDFLDLPWDPACLAFYESDRVVMTASREQVRQPIYRTSVERWRRYPKFTAELQASGIDAIEPA